VTSLRKTVVLNDKQVDPEYSLSQLKRIIDRGNVQQLEHFISMEYARNEDKMKLVEEAIAYAMRFKHMDISARLESHLKDLQVKVTVSQFFIFFFFIRPGRKRPKSWAMSCWTSSSKPPSQQSS